MTKSLLGSPAGAQQLQLRFLGVRCITMSAQREMQAEQRHTKRVLDSSRVRSTLSMTFTFLL